MTKSWAWVIAAAVFVVGCGSEDGGGGAGAPVKEYHCGINQLSNPCQVLDGDWFGAFLDEDGITRTLKLSIASDDVRTVFTDVYNDGVNQNIVGTISNSAVNAHGFSWAADDGGSGHALPMDNYKYLLWYNDIEEIGILQKGATALATDYNKSDLIGDWTGVHWDLQGDTRPLQEREIYFTIDANYDLLNGSATSLIIGTDFTFSGQWDGAFDAKGYLTGSYSDDRGKNSDLGAFIAPDKSALAIYECRAGNTAPENCSVWLVTPAQ